MIRCFHHSVGAGRGAKRIAAARSGFDDVFYVSVNTYPYRLSANKRCAQRQKNASHKNTKTHSYLLTTVPIMAHITHLLNQDKVTSQQTNSALHFL
jgi:hypothetical protein